MLKHPVILLLSSVLCAAPSAVRAGGLMPFGQRTAGTAVAEETGGSAAGSSDTLAVRSAGRAFSVQVHGTVRGKFEYQPEIGKGRFEVRNARFSLSGDLLPAVAYKAEIDLSDEGSIKMLDAYVRLGMLRRRLSFTIGQMRVPFTIDAHRSPHEQYFANRSFIAKQAGNVRDVGATLGWRFGRRVPVVLEAGVFNGSGLTAQKDFWTGRFNYSLKAQARLGGRFNLSASVQKIRPGEVDIMMYDAGAYYEHGRWHVEGEYLRKEYADGLFPGVNAVDAFVCRDFPLRRWFRKVSVLARYDYMSDHSDGLFGKGGVLETDDARRHRRPDVQPRAALHGRHPAQLRGLFLPRIGASGPFGAGQTGGGTDVPLLIPKTEPCSLPETPVAAIRRTARKSVSRAVRAVFRRITMPRAPSPVRCRAIP